MKNKYICIMLLLSAVAYLFSACKKAETITNFTAPDCSGGTNSKNMGAGVPQWIQDNFTCVNAQMSGSTIVFQTIDLPPYQSAYYQPGDYYYTSTMPGGNKHNPNNIAEQSYTVNITSTPTIASKTTASNGDCIGVSVKGTILFNNQAAPGDVLATELTTMDTAGGHPQNQGSYHHHTEPLAITNNDTALVGIMLDGFPLYGRKCAGQGGATASGLDSSNGHSVSISGAPTLYHYHVTAADPYFIGSYKGTPGTFSN